jgi:nucleoside-diphosphate-sugar epimerase
MRILICGAGGNLGGLLASHLLEAGYDLTLMWHRHLPDSALCKHPSASPVQADLEKPASLAPALRNADVVVHLAGRLFAPRPARFLGQTNVGYMERLVEAAVASGSRRLVFVSFPQVEGASTPEQPGQGALDGQPVSIHARTRLEAEQRLFALAEGTGLEPVVVRSGEVYGRGVKLIEAARKLMRLGLMSVWPGPTWYHLIALPDFLRGVEAAAVRPGLGGVYPLGDDRPLTLQAGLDRLAEHWGYRRPWRFPPSWFMAAARWVELAALLVRAPAPLTQDLIRLAQVDHCMDTARMKSDLLPELDYPGLEQGLVNL